MQSSWARRGAVVAVSFALSACSTVWAPGSAGSAGDVVAVRGYDGPIRELAQVAMLFGRDPGGNAGGQWICEIDGHSLQRTIRLSQRCANVVYLLPGEHELLWRYRSFQYRVGYRGHGDIDGTGRLHVVVEAGKVYELTVNGFSESAGVYETSFHPDKLSYGAISWDFGHDLIDFRTAEPLPPLPSK